MINSSIKAVTASVRCGYYEICLVTLFKKEITVAKCDTQEETEKLVKKLERIFQVKYPPVVDEVD